MSNSLWPCSLVGCQVPLSMGFSRQEYWSGLPSTSPGDLPDPGIEPCLLHCRGDSLPSEPLGLVLRTPVKIRISIEWWNKNSRAKHESLFLQVSWNWLFNTLYFKNHYLYNRPYYKLDVFILNVPGILLFWCFQIRILLGNEYTQIIHTHIHIHMYAYNRANTVFTEVFLYICIVNFLNECKSMYL